MNSRAYVRWTFSLNWPRQSHIVISQGFRSDSTNKKFRSSHAGYNEKVKPDKDTAMFSQVFVTISHKFIVIDVMTNL